MTGIGLRSIGVLAVAAMLCASSTLTREPAAAEMNREFAFGRQMALDGIEWQMTPPVYTAPQSQVTQQ